MGEVFQDIVLPLIQVPVIVTLVPVQVVDDDDVIVGGSNGFTFTTKLLLVTVHGGCVQVNV
jgi:hypothetical protein